MQVYAYYAGMASATTGNSYSLNPSLLRTSTNSGWSRMGVTHDIHFHEHQVVKAWIDFVILGLLGGHFDLSNGPRDESFLATAELL